MKTILFLFLLSASLYGAEPYKQPADNGIREIIVTGVYDGDTITATVNFGKLGRTLVQVHGVRLRLKNVNAYEMNAKEPKDRELAVVERAVLTKLLQETGIITARLYHQTYDRYEAEVYTRKGSVNAAMRTYPQNK